MPRIFVNHRLLDSKFAALQVAEYLINEFGEDQVFFDKRNIPSGEEWAKVIRRALQRSDIFIVVMGSNWLEELKKRANNPENDWVRIEIQFALANKLKIFPLSIDTQMPSASDLPPDIAGLASIQDIGVRYRYFETDLIALKNVLIPLIDPISKASVKSDSAKSNIIVSSPATLPEFMPNSKETYRTPLTAASPVSPIPLAPTAPKVENIPSRDLRSNKVISTGVNIVTTLSETKQWKTWGLWGLYGVLAIVFPLTLISSLSQIIGWGGIVFGILGSIFGVILGIFLANVVLYTIIFAIGSLIVGAAGGAVIGIVQAIINRLPVGVTAINGGRDISIVLAIIGTILGFLLGIRSQFDRYSYSNDDNALIASVIMGVVGAILGIAIAVDAWGPKIPFGDAIGQLISVVLFWSILLSLIGGVLGIVFGVIYDKLS